MEDKNKNTVYDKVNISKRALNVVIAVFCIMLTLLIVYPVIF